MHITNLPMDALQNTYFIEKINEPNSNFSVLLRINLAKAANVAIFR